MDNNFDNNGFNNSDNGFNNDLNNSAFNAQNDFVGPNNTNHGAAIAGLVLGIVGVVCTTILCCFYWIGLVCSVVGLIVTIMAKNAGNTESITKAALVLNIIGLVLSGIWIILGIVGSSATTTDFLNNYIKNHQSSLNTYR